MSCPQNNCQTSGCECRGNNNNFLIFIVLYVLLAIILSSAFCY